MPRTVLLLHRLPDGSSHYDWLVARDGGDDGRGVGPVPTFRVGVRIDAGDMDAFAGERIGDHRPLYLEHEGPVSGGRGTVERVAEGAGAIELEESDRFVASVDWGDGLKRYEGRPDGDRWRFVVTKAGDASR